MLPGIQPGYAFSSTSTYRDYKIAPEFIQAKKSIRSTTKEGGLESEPQFCFEAKWPVSVQALLLSMGSYWAHHWLYWGIEHDCGLMPSKLWALKRQYYCSVITWLFECKIGICVKERRRYKAMHIKHYLISTSFGHQFC